MIGPMTATLAPTSGRRGLLDGRVLAFATIVISALVLRTAVTSITPLLEELGDEVGFGSVVAGVFGMLPTALFALFGLATPWMIRRLDLEAVAVWAMLLSAAGLIARSLVSDTGLLLLFSAVALGGMGIGNVVIPPLVKRYFSDRVALLSAMYITGVQLGTAIPPLVAVPVAEAAGWRISLGMWALVALAALLPALGLWWSHRREDSRTVAPAPATAQVAAPVTGDDADAGIDADADADAPAIPAPVAEDTGGPLMRTSLAWGMAGMFGMTSLITYSIFTWLPRILTDAGGSAGLGGSMVALFSAMGFISALGAPSLCARVPNPFPVVLVCVAAYLIGFAGLYFAPMTATWVWVVFVGLGPSTFPIALTLINLRTRTHQGSAQLSGFTQGVGYTAACAGPLLFGVLRDSTGGWAWPFVLLLVAMAVMTAGSYQATKPRMLEDLW